MSAHVLEQRSRKRVSQEEEGVHQVPGEPSRGPGEPEQGTDRRAQVLKGTLLFKQKRLARLS